MGRGGVSIPCQPVTPAVSISNSNTNSQTQCVQIREQSTVKISEKRQIHVNGKSADKISAQMRYVEKSTVKIRLTRTRGKTKDRKTKDRIRCHRGVSIF
jgi:hypothetical protein